MRSKAFALFCDFLVLKKELPERDFLEARAMLGGGGLPAQVVGSPGGLRIEGWAGGLPSCATHPSLFRISEVKAQR